MKRRSSPRLGWDVSVGPALKQSYEMHYSGTGAPDTVPGMIAVRLTLNGEVQMAYGMLSIADGDFEERITTMKAEALEKAAALNAVGATC